MNPDSDHPSADPQPEEALQLGSVAQAFVARHPELRQQVEAILALAPTRDEALDPLDGAIRLAQGPHDVQQEGKFGTEQLNALATQISRDSSEVTQKLQALFEAADETSSSTLELRAKVASAVDIFDNTYNTNGTLKALYKRLTYPQLCDLAVILESPEFEIPEQVSSWPTEEREALQIIISQVQRGLSIGQVAHRASRQPTPLQAGQALDGVGVATITEPTEPVVEESDPTITLAEPRGNARQLLSNLRSNNFVKWGSGILLTITGLLAVAKKSEGVQRAVQQVAAQVLSSDPMKPPKELVAKLDRAGYDIHVTKYTLSIDENGSPIFRVRVNLQPKPNVSNGNQMTDQAVLTDSFIPILRSCDTYAEAQQTDLSVTIRLKPGDYSSGLNLGNGIQAESPNCSSVIFNATDCSGITGEDICSLGPIDELVLENCPDVTELPPEVGDRLATLVTCGNKMTSESLTYFIANRKKTNNEKLVITCDPTQVPHRDFLNKHPEVVVYSATADRDSETRIALANDR